MRTLLQLAATLALFAFGAGVAVIAFYGVHVLRDMDATVRHADAVLGKAEGEWQNEKADVHQIIARTQDAANQAALFAQEQRIQLRKTSADSDHQIRTLGLVTRNAETLLYNLDQQLNGKILPDFDRELTATSAAAQFSFKSFTKASDALNFQINDPAIPQMLESFNRAADSLATASANGASILGHADHVADYYDKKLTTPLGFWKTLLKTSLSIGSQAGNISAGFVK
jgi:hypothetical protein